MRANRPSIDELNAMFEERAKHFWPEQFERSNQLAASVTASIETAIHRCNEIYEQRYLKSLEWIMDCKFQEIKSPHLEEEQPSDSDLRWQLVLLLVKEKSMDKVGNVSKQVDELEQFMDAELKQPIEEVDKELTLAYEGYRAAVNTQCDILRQTGSRLISDARRRIQMKMASGILADAAAEDAVDREQQRANLAATIANFVESTWRQKSEELQPILDETYKAAEMKPDFRHAAHVQVIAYNFQKARNTMIANAVKRFHDAAVDKDS